MQKVAETKILHQKAVDYIKSLANKVLAVRSSKKAGYFLNLLLKELKALKGWIEGLKQANNSVKIAGLIKVYSATQFEKFQQVDDTPVGKDYVNKVAPIRNDLDTLFEYLGQNNLAGATQILDDSIQAIDEMINTLQTLTEEYPSEEPPQEEINLNQYFKKGDTLAFKPDRIFDVISIEGNNLKLMSPEGEVKYYFVDSTNLQKLLKFKNAESEIYEKHSIPITQLSMGDILEVEGELWVILQKKPGTAKYLTENLVDDKQLVFDPRGLKQVEILTQDGVEKLIEEFIKENKVNMLPRIIKEEYDYLF